MKVSLKSLERRKPLITLIIIFCFLISLAIDYLYAVIKLIEVIIELIKTSQKK